MKITLLRTSGAIAFALLAGCIPEVPEQTGTGGSSVAGAGGTTSPGGTTGVAGTTSTAGTTGTTGTTGGTGSAGIAGTAGDTGSGGSGGSGGSTGGAGGAISGAGTGGSSAGTGGSSAGTGGSSAGAGGSSAGAGGSSAGAGGSSAGAGGSSAGAGGSSAGAGGSSAGAGGSSAGAGGGGAGGFNPCPTNGDPCRILPLGDSITYGINQEGSYRIELFHKALGAQQKITYTGTLMNGPTMVDAVTFPRNHESTNGITIKGISDQITKNKTLNVPSDIIIVHIGTNDMYQNTSTASPAMAPTNLGNLLDQLITGMPNALIVVCKIIPLSLASSAVNTFNAAIPGVVQTRADAGKHVIVVDLSALPSGGMSSDNVHPNPTGYAWMGDHLYDAIGSQFPK